MITKLLNEVNEKIETLNNLVQDKEYFEKLDERIEKVNNYVQEQQQENKRLNNIINELEKYLGLELMKTREPIEYNKGLHNAFGYIKNKLQELKGDESNEKI